MSNSVFRHTISLVLILFVKLLLDLTLINKEHKIIPVQFPNLTFLSCKLVYKIVKC